MPSVRRTDSSLKRFTTNFSILCVSLPPHPAPDLRGPRLCGVWRASPTPLLTTYQPKQSAIYLAQLHGIGALLDNSYFSQSINYPHFTELSGSLHCFQNTASGPYPVPDGTIPTFISFFFKVRFIITLPGISVKIFRREKRHIVNSLFTEELMQQ